MFWGQWSPHTRTITIAHSLLAKFPWHDVIGVLRHEMAHQFVDEALQQATTPHGNAFQAACEKVGVPGPFRHAQVHLQQLSLDWRQTAPSSQNEKLLDKIHKLLQLATSTNEHEASLAMQKVQELYAKHHLEEMQNQKILNFYHGHILTSKKRLTSLEQRIISLLCNHYFVQVIVGFSYNIHLQIHERSIEIIGTRENVLMAEYVYHFLKKTCAQLAKNKKLNSQKNRRSYQLGLIAGLDEQLDQSQNSTSSEIISQALVLFRKDPQLPNYISQIHPRLVSITSHARLASRSIFEEGKGDGKKITIHKPIEKSSSSGLRLFLK